MPGDTDLLTTLRARVTDTLAEMLPRGSDVAFVNYPNIDNAGDPAIWLATHQVLRRLGVRVRYVCEPDTYDRDTLARRIGAGGTILLQGGGNFGDVYRRQQGVRERVLADFPAVRTVQLPQSIWFQDPANLERVRRLCEAHRDLTLLVREGASERYARERFAVPITACPDMAFALEGLPPRRDPDVDVVWLARDDRETPSHTVPDVPDGVRRLDWLGPLDGAPPPPRATYKVNRRLTARMQRHPRAARRWWRVAALTYPSLARWRVARGCAVLAGGRAVITDRLHGHVLCLLLGIPHVVMDNATGKVRSTYDTWTGPSPLAHWADDPEEALATARRLAEQGEAES